MAFGFSVPMFFITMREALEAAVVVSVLYSFVHQSFPKESFLFKRMNRLITLGTVIAIGICIVIGSAFLFIVERSKSPNEPNFPKKKRASAEGLWEGIEGLIAGIMLTFLSFAFLQSDELTEKWHKKLRKAFNVEEPVRDENDDSASIKSQESITDKIFSALLNYFTTKEKKKAEVQVENNDGLEISDDSKDKAVLTPSNTAGYTMFILPFITVLREGLECVVFFGGIGIASDPGTIPLAAAFGFLAGGLIGYGIFKAGNSMKARTFFFAATVFLLLLSVGLLTRSVGKIETFRFQQSIGTNVDLTESNGVYDVNTTLWFLNCCNPEEEVPNNYGWQILSAVFGWNRQGTKLTVGLYVGYCLFVSVILIVMKLWKLRKFRLRKAKRLAREAAKKEKNVQLEEFLDDTAGENVGGPSNETLDTKLVENFVPSD
ncbi:high-affinity iron permease [Physocladia obscura]|uniref:High-affinity iron permease n=1 Tax=Physocladia obscura TaxID=109957 RepID=A0AAD5T1A5_9FUNG|nr:high-affinity iron permease [Physocladia obscura]